ncbi:TOM1_2 [Sanghuangporus vaninii]
MNGPADSEHTRLIAPYNRPHDALQNDDMQVKVFIPKTKDTLCEVLEFERLPLENSTNRKIFNSYDICFTLHSSTKLFTKRDVVAIEQFNVRGRSRYSNRHAPPPSQSASAHSLHISTSWLESLAKTVPAIWEHGIEMLDLVGKGSKKGEVQGEKPKNDTTVFQSSSCLHPFAQSYAPYTVHLSPLARSSGLAMDIFADTVKSHQYQGTKVETLSERIRFEDLAIEKYGTNDTAQSASNAYRLMPFTRAVFRDDRGNAWTIDSSFLEFVQSIIEYRGVFEPTVLPLIINVIATFVHNEPTSLTAIQIAKLPETIYIALAAGIKPSFEVIQSIPDALGALCLNQMGQDQLTSRPSITPALFSVFTSEAHLKVLLEKENAVS